MGTRIIEQDDKEKRFEWGVRIILVILFLSALTLLKLSTAQTIYPTYIQEDTFIETDSTLWILTDAQYTQCLYNTMNLISAYEIIEKLELNAQDQDTIILLLKKDLIRLEDDYLRLFSSYEEEKQRKRIWRGAALITTSVAIIETLIYFNK